MPTQVQLPALTMPYTDAATTLHPAACAYFSTMAFDIADLQTGLTVYWYHDAAAATEGLQADLTGGTRPATIAQKTYPLGPADFLRFAAAPGQAGVPLAQELFQDALGVALSVLDTAQVDAQGQPALDTGGKTALVSALAGAVMTLLTITVP